jgi:hypothetical protein
VSGFEDDAKEFEDRLRMIRRVCLESRREGVNVEGDPEEFLSVIAAVLEYQKRFRLVIAALDSPDMEDAQETLRAVRAIVNGEATKGDPT